MGKPSGKKKNHDASKSGDATGKTIKISDRTSKAIDEDTAIFINMSQELKEEGNKLYKKRDREGAMLTYEKALKLLPKNHIDVAYLRTNMAGCYMQMGLGEYPRAINECNLALEVSSRYSKALLRRAKCYESLNRLDLAFRDARIVLNMEPNNLSATEIFERVKKELMEKGVNVIEMENSLANSQLTGASRLRKVVKEKLKKKKKSDIDEERKSDKSEDMKSGKSDGRKSDKSEDMKSGKSDGKKGDTGENRKNDECQDKPINIAEDKKSEKGELKNTEDKLGLEEKKMTAVRHKELAAKTVDEEGILIIKPIKEAEVVTRTVKLVLEEDIRWAQLPLNCSIGLLRDIVRDRFPSLKGALVKYKDQEGDLVTITTTDELRLAESSGDSQGCLRLFIAEVNPDQEPTYEGGNNEENQPKLAKHSSSVAESGNAEERAESVSGLTCIEDWIVQFARLFKNHVGFDSDSYLDLHERGMKLYSVAMEDTIAGEEAQELFNIAADKFQEMAALAVFNWGNVYMSTARKRVLFTEDNSRESILSQVKTAYEWALTEYKKAGARYEQALKIKPDFYEGLLALGQQQFEQAKLCWYYAVGTKMDLENGPDQEVLILYNKAEDSMERGMLMWEEFEEQRLNGLSKFDKFKSQLQKMGLEGLLNEVSAEEAAEQAANMSSQIYLLWGTLLYERSIVEYKLELPTWEECLEVAVEKFELAGASPTDVAVMLKNHCSNGTALEGLGFKIDEIVQAWNEMYDARRWQIGVPSFRLEPLFRRRTPRLHYILENI